MNIRVSKDIREAWAPYKGAAVMATVKNTPYQEGLWEKINDITQLYRSKYTTATIKEIAPIQASREAY